MADRGRINLLCLIPFSLAVIEIVHTSKFDFIMNGRQEFKLDNSSVLTSFYDTSIDGCASECLSRQRCHSISYHTSAHVCYLGTVHSNATTSGIIPAKGYILSDSSNLYKKREAQCEKRCNQIETCDYKNGRTRCKVRECGPPPHKPGTVVYGNMHAVGATIKYVCTSDPCSVLPSTCLGNGTWSDSNMAVCKTDLPSLEKKKFHITCSYTGKWWHNDASIRGRLDTMHSQGSQADVFTEFSFIKLNTSRDRFFIRRNGFYVVDAGSYLAAYSSSGPEEFIITHFCNGFQLFHVKSQRYVHVGRTQLATTRGNLTDETSIFTFDEI